MLRNAYTLAAFGLALSLGAVSAHAATLDTFTFVSPAINGPLTASLAASPTPSSFVPGVSFTLNASVTFEGDTLSGPVTFYTAGGAGGGGSTFSGPVLFSGPVSAPTFLLGTYTLSGMGDLGEGNQLITGQLTISQPNPVPEPAPIAMTITGVLGLAEVLRRRRQELRSVDIHC